MTRATDRSRATWRRLSKGIAAATIASFASAGLLWTYFGSTRPTVDEPTPGRAWVLNHHGRQVFLLDGELALLVALLGLSLVGVVVTVAIELLADPWNRRRGPP